MFLQTYCIYSQVQTLPQLGFRRSDEVRRDYCVYMSTSSLSLSASFSFALSSFLTLPAPFTLLTVTLLTRVVVGIVSNKTKPRLIRLKNKDKPNTLKGTFQIQVIGFFLYRSIKTFPWFSLLRHVNTLPEFGYTL